MSDGRKGFLGIETLESEPWVHLPNGAELATWTEEDKIKYNQANRQSQRLAFYVKTFDFISDNKIGGDYLEFGCHRVRTFRMALTEARRHNLATMRFLAFDSFEGLPEASTDPEFPVWKRGALMTSEDQFWSIAREHAIYVDRIETIKGFYDKSLTKDLQRRYLDAGVKIAMACVDCDLYESAVPVFEFIEPLLQEGSIVYIDDYYTGYRGSPLKGVSKAFDEWKAKSRFKYEPHLSVGWWGRSFITYAG